MLHAKQQQHNNGNNIVIKQQQQYSKQRPSNLKYEKNMHHDAFEQDKQPFILSAILHTLNMPECLSKCTEVCVFVCLCICMYLCCDVLTL